MHDRPEGLEPKQFEFDEGTITVEVINNVPVRFQEVLLLSELRFTASGFEHRGRAIGIYAESCYYQTEAEALLEFERTDESTASFRMRRLYDAYHDPNNMHDA